ncbi:uncharacterized protein V1518DRAFT_410259 [Limtongia smithiae]|uniref:uncharacterized protein n=1 Tax=Limtongia smithiae TaxID=1125753 RepID=UPI0034CE95FF
MYADMYYVPHDIRCQYAPQLPPYGMPYYAYASASASIGAVHTYPFPPSPPAPVPVPAPAPAPAPVPGPAVPPPASHIGSVPPFFETSDPTGDLFVSFRRAWPVAPSFDVINADKQITVRVKLPGVRKDHVSVTCPDTKTVRIAGHVARKAEFSNCGNRGDKDEKDPATVETYCSWAQRFDEKFERTLKLAEPIVKDSVSTTITDGDLVVTLKKVVKEKCMAKFCKWFFS